ncbi:radical SAM superfamily protein, partial [Chlamydia psittaci 08DC60]|jgi:hypothetical protein
LLD